MSDGLWQETSGSGAHHTVLLPDADRSSASWPPELVEELERQGRVTRIDLCGQGRSPHVGAPSVQDHAADVAAALAPSTRGEELTVLGHGLGGAVGVALASQLDAVRRVVSVNSSMWIIDPALPGPEEMLVVQLVWRQRDGVEGGEDLLDWLVREHRALLEPDLTEADAHPEALRAWLRTWQDWGFNARCGHRAAWLASAAVSPPPPGCDVTFVHGAANSLIDVAHAHHAAATVPNATLRVVEGVGHALGPAAVAALLDLI